MCTLMWSLSDPLCLKLFPHWRHVYGRSLVWILKWFASFPLYKKLLPHWGQVKSFFPVWILTCSSKSVFRPKTSSQWRHLKDFLLSDFCLPFVKVVFICEEPEDISSVLISGFWCWCFSSSSFCSSLSYVRSSNRSKMKRKIVRPIFYVLDRVFRSLLC